MTKDMRTSSDPVAPNKARDKRARYALLIGVEWYKWRHKSDTLHAGRNDVMAYYKFCRRLGHRPENIRVLTTPKLSLEDFVRAEQEMHPEASSKVASAARGARVRKKVEAYFEALVHDEATKANIEEQLAWLARMCDSEGTEAGSPSGFLAFSGHGTRIEGELALCPCDVGKTFTRALRVRDVSRRFSAGAKENLTVVLDCCFAAAREGEPESKLATGKAGSSLQRVPFLAAPPDTDEAATSSTSSTSSTRPRRPSRAPEISKRVFCASGPDEPSVQRVLGGYWHSAFSWALTTALEQWKIEDGAGLAYSTVSHTELLFRARMLLRSLSIPQHPRLVGDFGLSNAPVGCDYRSSSRGKTSQRPDVKGTEGQIDPSDKSILTIMQIKDGSDLIVEGIIVRTSYKDFAQGFEYWYTDQTKYDSSTKAGPLTLVRTTVDTTERRAGDAVLTRKQQVVWDEVTAPPDWVAKDTKNNSSFGISVRILEASLKILRLTWFGTVKDKLFRGTDAGSWTMAKPSTASSALKWYTAG